MFIIFFLLGLIIGSFLNVVVCRLKLEETLLGRSYCHNCQTQIEWYDNIPLVSFILLKFQCRKCKTKISFQYPLVEFFTGVIFILISWKFFDLADTQSFLVTLYYFGIAAFLIAIFVYDWLYMEIPSLVLWPAIFWALAFQLYFDWGKSGNFMEAGTYSGIFAAILAFSFFFLLVAVSREKWMGMGDAYLAIVLGLILGWPNILLALFLAFSLGAIYGIILIGLKKKTIKSQVPFAPFLILGSMITLFFAQPIIHWYLRLFF